MFSRTKKLNSYNRYLRFLYISLMLYLSALIAPVGAAHLDVLKNSCVDCHTTLSPFTDEQKRINEIRLNHTVREISCSLECHEDVIRRTASDNFQQWSDSDHSKYHVTCDACHGGNPDLKTEAEAHAAMKDINDPDSTIYFKNIPDTCGECHAEELEHFKNTMHYQRLRSTASGPSCITCHQPHSFKILKASELTALCSVCHNPKDKIAAASVPQDAKRALEKQKEFQEELLKAKSAVADAKAAGGDISYAQMDLDRAISVMNNIPSLWHEFNLKDFDQQIQNGIDWAKKAQYKTSDIETAVPAAPGPGIAMAFAILIMIYLMRKR